MNIIVENSILNNYNNEHKDSTIKEKDRRKRMFNMF